AGRHLHRGRRPRHLPPRHVQRAHAAASDVGADDVAVAAGPVRRPAAQAQPDPHQMADDVQPVDLPGHAPAGSDHGEGADRPTGGSPAPVPVRPVVAALAVEYGPGGPPGPYSTGGQPPRSSRAVDTASRAYTSAPTAAGNTIVAAICNGVWPKNTAGASVK